MNGETFKMVDNQVPAYQKPKKATLPSMYNLINEG
jgi:competence protein ComGC